MKRSPLQDAILEKEKIGRRRSLPTGEWITGNLQALWTLRGSVVIREKGGKEIVTRCAACNYKRRPQVIDQWLILPSRTSAAKQQQKKPRSRWWGWLRGKDKQHD